MLFPEIHRLQNTKFRLQEYDSSEATKRTSICDWDLVSAEDGRQCRELLFGNLTKQTILHRMEVMGSFPFLQQKEHWTNKQMRDFEFLMKEKPVS